jgi:hypothetical protein
MLLLRFSDLFAVWKVLNRRRNGEIEQQEGNTPSLGGGDAVEKSKCKGED